MWQFAYARAMGKIRRFSNDETILELTVSSLTTAVTPIVSIGVLASICLFLLSLALDSLAGTACCGVFGSVMVGLYTLDRYTLCTIERKRLIRSN